MKEHDEISHLIDECIKLLDENVGILNDVEYSLESEKEDIVKTDLTKSDLVDMAHDVADSSRIKKAESDFVKRYLEKKSD